MKRIRSAMTLLLALAAAPLSGCLTDPCEELMCPAMQRCDRVSGLCIGQCSGVACPAGYSCVEATGRCVFDGVQRPAPTIGAVIDRAGRPLVNTALVNPYDLFKPAGATQAEDGAVTRDRYNLDGDPAQWVGHWQKNVEAHLAYLDALDGFCANQILATTTGARYAPLASVLADDRLFLDAAAAQCRGIYLAVERGGLEGDCGGRQLSTDVVDSLYSVLIIGNSSGVTDAAGFSANTSSNFPFLGGPTQ